MQSDIVNLLDALSSIMELYSFSVGKQEVSEFLGCCYFYMKVSWEKYAFFIGNKCKEDWHDEPAVLDCELSENMI